MKNELFIFPKKRKEILIQRKNLTIVDIESVSSDDYFYPDESLKKLRDMNKEYSVIFFGERFWLVREDVDNHIGRAEIYIMKKDGFHFYYGDESVAMRKNGKVVRQPLPKAWLQWSGKRVSALQCLGERPDYVEGRTINGDARYYDESTYVCAEKPRMGSRCAGCPHSLTIGRLLECKYSIGN